MKIPKMLELQPPSLGTTSFFSCFQSHSVKDNTIGTASLVTLKPVNATMAEESASSRVATPVTKPRGAEWMVFRVLIQLYTIP